MQQLKAFLQLVRWRNLLIVMLTQWFIWWCVLRPMNSWSNYPVFLNTFHFVLLSLSTLFIAAAGYIINDYFDVKIDLINRPQKVIIERSISSRAGILWHSGLNIAGIAIAVLLAFRLNNYWVPVIQISCSVLLWFYSTTYKRRFVSGNLIVALLTALTILIIPVYEPALQSYIDLRYFLEEGGKVLVNPFGVIAVYAYFAFMLTWMREVVKDMEDFKGDAEDGCITMPIKIGLHRSTRFVQLLGMLAVFPLLVASIRLFRGSWAILGVYLLITVIVPLLLWMWQLPRKATSEHYGTSSRQLKLIMLSGIISLLLYYILQY
jgi:4-hydroxybenzoate polyprenyltransferase